MQNRALQRDVRVAQNELKLTESETERLRDDNLDLRDEVTLPATIRFEHASCALALWQCFPVIGNPWFSSFVDAHTHSHTHTHTWVDLSLFM